MTSAPTSEITGLLVDWSNGDQAAFDKLLPLVERELHRLAHAYMRRENRDHTLQTTALVNEAYLKLTDQNKTHWQNRAHFFAIAAKIMRRILLNYARDQHRQKRGGNAVQVSLSDVSTMCIERPEELIALDEALERFAQIYPRQARVVELKFFGGLERDEIAEVLKVAPITVTRDWTFARAWLLKEMKNGGGEESE